MPALYTGKKGQSVADGETLNAYRVLHIPCWVKESRLRNSGDSIRNNGLLPVTSVEQWRWQMCCQAIDIVKNQENLKFLLQFPQGKEFSPSPDWAKPGDHQGMGNTLLTQKLGKVCWCSPWMWQDIQREFTWATGRGWTPKVSQGHSLQFRQKVYFFLQWQVCDSGNHAGQTLCALLESLRWRWTLGWASADTHALGHLFSSCPPPLLCSR